MSGRAAATSWDDLILALYEGLDGVDYKTAKRVHKVLYPKARVYARGPQIYVKWPAEPEEEEGA